MTRAGMAAAALTALAVAGILWSVRGGLGLGRHDEPASREVPEASAEPSPSIADLARETGVDLSPTPPSTTTTMVRSAGRVEANRERWAREDEARRIAREEIRAAELQREVLR